MVRFVQTNYEVTKGQRIGLEDGRLALITDVERCDTYVAEPLANETLDFWNAVDAGHQGRMISRAVLTISQIDALMLIDTYDWIKDWVPGVWEQDEMLGWRVTSARMRRKQKTPS